MILEMHPIMLIGQWEKERGLVFLGTKVIKVVLQPGGCPKFNDNFVDIKFDSFPSSFDEFEVEAMCCRCFI